jgi:hypothetical protein
VSGFIQTICKRQLLLISGDWEGRCNIWQAETAIKCENIKQDEAVTNCCRILVSLLNY